MCRNSRKNFLDEMTDLLMLKRTRFKCIKTGIRTSWTRWQICGLIYEDEENWVLQCAKINMKNIGACLWFRFCRCMECDLFSFLLVFFFLFPHVWWQNNWSVDRGHSPKIQLWDRVKRVFVGRWRGQERDSKCDENKIQKCAKLTTRNLGSLWRTVWRSQGANL